MPTITTVTRSSVVQMQKRPNDVLDDGSVAKSTIDDVRFVLTFVLSDGTTKTLNAITSYKKHLASSYFSAGDYKPTSAFTEDRNTITNLSITEFCDAFGEYGDVLIREMTGKDTASLVPQTIRASTTKGIDFVNNNDRFGKYFHCFPALPASSTRAVDLSGRELQDFAELMRFFASGGFARELPAQNNKSWWKEAKKLHDKYKNAPWLHILLDAEQLQRVQELIDSPALQRRYDQALATEREEREFLGKMGAYAGSLATHP